MAMDQNYHKSAGTVEARKNLLNMNIAELNNACFTESGQWNKNSLLTEETYFELCYRIVKKEKKQQGSLNVSYHVAG